MVESPTRNPVRVRFAPSPTGYLHIGGARTALFNFLFARRHTGVFVLRIEDTDRQRSTPEAIAAIYDGLRYLGLDWDEGPERGGEHGPYLQSLRAGRYGQYVEELLAAGNAYRCFCARERLAELRERQRSEKRRILYDRRCLGLDAAEARGRAESGEAFVVRFRVPEGKTVVRDLVRHEVVFDHREIEDFIIQRADGTSVYNLVVAVDDHEMQISHVIRGEDHLSNTPKQVLLLEALGFAVPQYAHIPLILGPGGGKLSKRHGAVSVTEYEKAGYLPEAMLNFLVRLGWSFDDKQEIFSLDELEEKFSLEGVSKSGAVYDLGKLKHLGGHYMRRRDRREIVELALPHVVAAGYVAQEAIEEKRARLEAMIALEKDRMECLSEIVEKVRYYFEEPTELEKGALKVLRKKSEMEPVVARYAASLEGNLAAEAWRPGDPAPLEEHARAFLEAEGRPLGDLAQPLRAVLTGRSATPGLFEVMSVLGRETVLGRLASAAEKFAQARETR
jgi:glutamyl-tRNA synthetase